MKIHGSGVFACNSEAFITHPLEPRESARGGNSSTIIFSSFFFSHLVRRSSSSLSLMHSCLWIARKDSQKPLGRVAPHASHSLLAGGLTRVHLEHATPSTCGTDILRAAGSCAGSTLRVSAAGLKSRDLLHISQMLVDCLL